MAATVIWTYEDAVQFLLDWHGVDRTSTSTLRNAKVSVAEALRSLYNKMSSGWSIYKTRFNFSTDVPYSTGTITYDSGSKTITLTGGTWPDWAAIGRFRFGTLRSGYSVESRVSDTVLKLDEVSAPPDDVLTASTYLLFRETYPLPVDFRSMDALTDTKYTRQLEVRERLDAVYDLSLSPSEPLYACIRGDQDYLGSMGLMIVPSPPDARRYEMHYSRSPRQLRHERVEVSAIACTAGSTSVTGTGFPAGCEGSVIRFSTSSTAPTDRFGTNPYYEQRVIVTRSSSSAITIDQPMSDTLASVAGIISDPIDIEYGSMMGAFKALCMLESGKTSNRKDWMELERRASLAVECAMEADSRLPAFGRANMTATSLSFGTSIIGIDA